MLTADAGIGLEERLILDLTRTRLAPRAEGGLGIEADGIDWERLVAVARGHGVLPLVRRALSEGSLPSLASDARSVVEDAADAAARRSLLMTSKLLQLLAELSAAGVAAVPWKGPVLAQMLWSDVAMRQYGDLDLLVRRADLERARDVLLATGFRRVAPLPAWQETSYVERNGELELIRDSDGLVVEVHWTVVPSYYASAMDPEGIWERLEKATIARRTVMTLGPEDLLVALSIHGFKHRWERLGWIADIARLVQVRPALDWAGLRQRTGRDGSQRIVRLAIGLAGRLFASAELRAAAHQLAQDGAADELVEELAAEVLHRMPDGHSVHVTSMQARGRERWRDRIAFVATALTTANGGDWALVTVPGRVSGVYRLIRPLRLVATYVNRARRRG